MDSDITLDKSLMADMSHLYSVAESRSRKKKSRMAPPPSTVKTKSRKLSHSAVRRLRNHINVEMSSPEPTPPPSNNFHKRARKRTSCLSLTNSNNDEMLGFSAVDVYGGVMSQAYKSVSHLNSQLSQRSELQMSRFSQQQQTKKLSQNIDDSPEESESSQQSQQVLTTWTKENIVVQQITEEPVAGPSWLTYIPPTTKAEVARKDTSKQKNKKRISVVKTKWRPKPAKNLLSSHGQDDSLLTPFETDAEALAEAENTPGRKRQKVSAKPESVVNENNISNESDLKTTSKSSVKRVSVRKTPSPDPNVSITSAFGDENIEPQILSPVVLNIVKRKDKKKAAVLLPKKKKQQSPGKTEVKKERGRPLGKGGAKVRSLTPSRAHWSNYHLITVDMVREKVNIWEEGRTVDEEDIVAFTQQLNEELAEHLNWLCNNCTFPYGMFTYKELDLYFRREKIIPKKCGPDFLALQMISAFSNEELERAEGILYPKGSRDNTTSFFMKD